jgi:two-component system, OmpR family, phosphate regulon sensor histidine kinase PhoR
MKPSASVASLLILLFFLSFNGLQVYLIIERIEEAKTKFGAAGTSAVMSALSDYHKMKSIDSASAPRYAWIGYAKKKIDVTRVDSQTVTFTSPFSSVVTDTVERALLEMILNNQTFRSIDLGLLDKLFQKSLRTKEINSVYRLDTITVQSRRPDRQRLQATWMQKQNSEFSHFTRPMPLPYNSNIFVFAQLEDDPAFFRHDLFWPMLAFALILLIGNTALLFVYRTIRKQKRINELKTDFINNITHEMKTPITIASAGLEAIEHHVPASERTNFYLHTSKRQLNLLNDFVERILDSAVQDVSDLTLKKEQIDVHALFTELVQSHSVLKGKPVSFELNTEGPVFIQGDRLHLQTAFHNIIDNAIKYSNRSVNINIDIAESSRDCSIKIRDNGMGIPAQYLKNIFEKFFRVPAGDAQSVKGFGLGLYYVNSIIKKHSGNISVHSRPQSGTEFIITLPKES